MYFMELIEENYQNSDNQELFTVHKTPSTFNLTFTVETKDPKRFKIQGLGYKSQPLPNHTFNI